MNLGDIELPKKLHRRYTQKRRGMESFKEPFVRDEDQVYSRSKKRKFDSLTMKEKLGIINDLYLDEKSHDEIAHKFLVKKQLIE